MTNEVGRDLVVGLQQVTSSYANGSAMPLLPNPIWTFIDSTLPFIYLPLESCQLFEKQFGLEWNSTSQLYPVNETLHESLLTSNPTFTFRLGKSLQDGQYVDLVLPYASFDLTGKRPLIPDGSRYFPLRRAANDTQYTIGRTLLQEA